MRRLVPLVTALALAACSDAPPPPELSGERWHAADRLFDGDNLWVGGDGAYSVDLGGDRILWLFGDSFIARQPGQRSGAAFIRNSVAVQHGRDPSRSLMQFHFRERDDSPSSFAPEIDDTWLWPGHGVRLDDRLLLFYEVVGAPADCDEPEWCFEGRGWTAFTVDAPDAPPGEWTLVPVQRADTPRGMQLGEAVLVRGEHVYVYATKGGLHELHVARFARDAARAGDLTSPEWYTDRGWRRGGEPEGLVGIGAPELSVHFEPDLDQYLMVFSEGFGSSTLAARAADRPEGPWSEPRDFIRPPESYDGGAHVYAGKAHPELSGADLVVTYVPGAVYFPRFVKARFR